MPWVQVLRSNRHNPDPLYLAIYGDVVYHHGAGLTGGLSPAHRALAPKAKPLPGNPVGDAVTRLMNSRRWSAGNAPPSAASRANRRSSTNAFATTATIAGFQS